MESVLFVCTANVCRSPMAEGFLRHHLDVHGVGDGVAVRSAGTADTGLAVSPDAVAVLATRGIDISLHRPALVDRAALGQADLVVGMAREHVRAVAVLEPSVWTRTFTLRELVRRATAVGARRPGDPLAAWLGAVAGGRRATDLLGDVPGDDVADPYGRPRRAFEETAAALADLIGRLADLTALDVASGR